MSKISNFSSYEMGVGKRFNAPPKNCFSFQNTTSILRERIQYGVSLINLSIKLSSLPKKKAIKK